jgi:glutamate-1-semialdehyde aminotransferase
MIKKLIQSFLLKERSRKVSPHFTQTFSRAPPTFVEGVYPVYAESANGSHFFDVDGNEYIDYLLGLGPITLGYNYKKINDAIIEQLKKGILFSLPHKVELELSELMCNTIPHCEMVKFEKSGSNAVTGAVRAARAFTKRDKIAYCGSGGVWHDWYASAISRNQGVPNFNNDLIKIFDYNDSDGLEQIFEDNPEEIAAVVLEPTVYEKPETEFLKNVQKISQNNNSLLILDEIVTGFRLDLGGAQKYFDIKGDLVCFGKGMGNGLPISAITGPTEFMKIFNDLWVSTTNGSENLSLAGTSAVINEMKNEKTIQHCWNIGEKLFNGWNTICKKSTLNILMIGYPVRMTLKCYDGMNKESEILKAALLQEMVKRGIFISPGPTFISYSHTSKDVELTLSALEEVILVLENIKNEKYDKILEGNLPQKIFTNFIQSTKKIKL